MTMLPSGLVTDVAATLASFLPSTGTVTRTGKALSCRVDPGPALESSSQEIKIAGLGQILRLRRWVLYFPAGSDVQIADTVLVAGVTYLVLGTTPHAGYPVILTTTCTEVALQTASTTRAGTVHQSSVTACSFLGALLLPLSRGESMARVDDESYQQRQVLCLWPTGSKEDWPIAPGDVLILPASQYGTGGSYAVRAVDVFPGQFLSVIVDVLGVA